MDMAASFRSRIKAGRKRGAWWVRVLDLVRLLPSGQGRAQLWVRLMHRGQVHQATPATAEDRYPELFDLSARLLPHAQRILSFGCSTGEELSALRRRFPEAEIVGAEINPRSRRIAGRRMRTDGRVSVVAPGAIEGTFDAVFALAVLQREPHRVTELELDDLSRFYPFARFDAAVTDLVERLRAGGLLCVINTHYRVEDSSMAAELESVAGAPLIDPPLFGRDGRRLERPRAATIFRKL